MSEFSEKLNSYVEKYNVKVSTLAAFLNTDRANLYKLLRGTRTPSSLEVVEKLSVFLSLNPMEAAEMRELYHMAMIGSRTYYQRKSALHFLTTDFYLQQNYDTPNQMLLGVIDQYDPAEGFPDPLPEKALALRGTQQIHQMLSLICKHSIVNSKSPIRIMAQPTWDYLLSLLQALGHLNNGLSIEHIFCLNTGAEPKDFAKANYNMHCIEKIMPLYGCNCQYQPYFFYDSVDSHYNNLQLFSYIVITDDYVLTCSSDIQQGMLLHQPDLVVLYQEQFASRLQMTNPLFQVIRSDVSDYMQMTLESVGASLDSTPCLLYYAPPEYLREGMGEGPMAEMFFQQVMAYMQQLKVLKDNRPTYSNFSDVGLISFMETGRIPSYPDEIYPQIPMDLRLKLLKNLCELPDEYLPLRLKPPLSQLPPVSCMVLNEHAGYFLVKKYDGTLTYLSLQEQTMRQTLYDFICHLEEEGYLHTVEESRDYLNSVLEKYQNTAEGAHGY